MDPSDEDGPQRSGEVQWNCGSATLYATNSIGVLYNVDANDMRCRPMPTDADQPGASVYITEILHSLGASGANRSASTEFGSRDG
jgi:hypothetical protein